MSEQLSLLYELQQIDTGLDQRQQWTAELDDGSKARQKLASATVALEAKQEELRGLESTYRRKELELQSADAERDQRSKKAYGGTVGDAKELSALEKKIAELKRRGGALEDELLTLMDQIEQTRELTTKGEALVRKLGTLTKQIEAEYAETKARFEREAEALRQQREQLAPRIEAAALLNYESSRAKLGGVAIAAIEGELCLSCRNVVPTAVIGRVRGGREIVKCENCRRILFIKP